MPTLCMSSSSRDPKTSGQEVDRRERWGRDGIEMGWGGERQGWGDRQGRGETGMGETGMDEGDRDGERQGNEGVQRSHPNTPSFILSQRVLGQLAGEGPPVPAPDLPTRYPGCRSQAQSVVVCKNQWTWNHS